MQPTNTVQLLHILRRTLNRVDPRLMGHGERVAILIYQILQELPHLSRHEVSAQCLLGLVHDIGAYKTDEIDDMMRFERYGVGEHSIYGYLYLKTLSPLGEAAQPILYHHLLYRDYGKVTPPLSDRDYAGLLFLADRVDMLAGKLTAQECLRWLAQHKGDRCDPYWVDLFLAAEARCGLLAQLQARNYSSVLEEMVQNLEFTPEEIRQYLSTIAYSIDFHSEFMVLHTVTTISVSRILAEGAGLSPREQEAVYYGALLHDVGKVACPVEILEKPGKLTDAEMDIMKHHVVITREILEGFIDQEVVEIAARHHERQDGSGYPQGLSGDQLTTAERIVAVADVVSALIRRRSYKGAFDKTTTLGILTQMRDKGAFCDDVIDTVLTHYDAVIDAAEQYGQPLTETYHRLLQEYQQLKESTPYYG